MLNELLTFHFPSDVVIHYKSIIMSSFFEGWTAYDIVGCLSKREVQSVLLDYPIEKRWFRSWDTIEEMILMSADNVKNVVYQSAIAKKKIEDEHRKEVERRRIESQRLARNVRRYIGLFLNYDEGDWIFIGFGLERERDFSEFMTLPSDDEERRCYRAFYEATSNEALSFRTCPVCGREKLVRDGERTFLLSDPSIVDVLRNSNMNGTEEIVIRGLLEVHEGAVNCWMCFDCMRSLERRLMPKMALANNLWIGDIPFELKGLTIPEQLLIARHYPRCYIFKLFPRDVDTHVSFDRLYTAMAGNASLYDLNTQEVVEMLRGQRMPSPVRALAAVIAITFVGTKRLPADWLKKTFRVRRRVVYDALMWLHEHNPIYADIHIDDG